MVKTIPPIEQYAIEMSSVRREKEIRFYPTEREIVVIDYPS